MEILKNIYLYQVLLNIRQSPQQLLFLSNQASVFFMRNFGARSGCNVASPTPRLAYVLLVKN
jgi:hypothetical protein